MLSVLEKKQKRKYDNCINEIQILKKKHVSTEGICYAVEVRNNILNLE